ncbi:MAG: zinc-dependent alcohol dehydrogenase [Acidimicrobiales bacterium]
MTDLPEVMPVAVLRRPGTVVVEERPVPRPGPDEVLVEVDHCGICGSDIHMLLEGWGQEGLVAGHEFAGTIAALGDEVVGWEIGQQVVGGTSPKCLRCRRCLEGKPSQCENRQGSVVDGRDGAFARYVLVPAAALLELPAGLTMRQAALAEPLAVALHGITRSGAVPGDTVMVIGAGPIGALAIAALAARGIGPILAVEPGERRRRLARDLGAEVMTPDELEVFPTWEPERIAARAAHVVLECSGKKSAMEAGFHQLRRGGTLVLVGAGLDQPAFDPNRFILNELHVVGSFVYDQDGFERALDLLASDRFPTDLLIEADDVPLHGLSDALVGLAEGRHAGKVMVAPWLVDGAAGAGAGDRGDR